MATYTAAQLYGTGSIGENLSGASTFAFTNPGDSSYFTLETVPNATGSYAGAPLNTSGSWVVSASMGFVSSSYVASVVVQPGSSSLTFTPAASVTGTTYRLRGTGTYSLTIGGSGGGALLLDTYSGSAAAYSLRQLSSTYTGSAIRVRRSSDNTETNIGFVANALDTASLLTFCGAGSGFVTTWYDQSGNSRNAIQSTAGNQPQIVLTGTLYTLNGKPSVYWDNASSQYLITSTFASPISQPISTYTVSKVADIAINASVIYDSAVATGFSLLHGGNSEPPPGNLALFINSGTSIGIEATTTDTKLVSVLNNTANSNVFVNGVQKVTNQNPGSNSLSGITIGNLRPLGLYNVYSFYGGISELVFYPSLQTANNTLIQNNINSHYTIY
jgi:hypothetical protein